MASIKRENYFIVKRIILYAILIFVGISMAMPFLWMLSTAFKTQAQALSFPPEWIPRPFIWKNFEELFEIAPFGLYFMNSIFITVCRTVGQLIFSIISAYAFARLKFPGRDKIFLLYLGTMMIPFHVRLIPLYIIMREFSWLDTYYALIIPTMFTAFGTFLLRQFFLTIPVDLEDAAIIDGCNSWGVLMNVILPLAKPGIAALTTFSFLGAWNQFMYPLIMTSSDAIRVLPVGIALLQNQYYTEYRLLSAASVIAVIPVVILFFFTQKYFIRGIALTGMKS